MAKIADMVEKISESVTEGYQKTEDKFTEKFLEEDGSMCFAMQVVGNSIALGTFIGVWGVAAMIAAYPVYRTIFKKAKAKYQPRILELAAELCGETSES